MGRGTAGDQESARVATACLVWVLVAGLAQTPKRVAVEWNAPSLLTHGPYAFTRNPMYVAELGLRLGWVLFYGSLVVLAGFCVLWAVVSVVALPREERALEARFGERYVRYNSTVPRWLGRMRH
jgi:protein-S-isoprenylcysteine O-methyltransferase Ste14